MKPSEEYFLRVGTQKQLFTEDQGYTSNWQQELAMCFSHGASTERQDESES